MITQKDSATSTFTTASRVLLIDDHDCVRQGLKSLFNQYPEEFVVIGEASHAAEAQDFIINHEVDLVVLDIALRGRSGLELLKQIKSLHARLPVIILSMFEHHLYAARSIKAGASAYVEKTSPAGQIIDTARQVLSDPQNGETAAGEMARYSLDLEALSDRELELFHLIGEGLDKHQIANNLNISLRTVETHRERIRAKLSLQNFRQVETMAVRFFTLEGLAKE